MPRLERGRGSLATQCARDLPGTTGYQVKSGLGGAKRVIAAGKYSLAGLGFAWTREAAFRQGVILALVAMVAAQLVPFERPVRILLTVLPLLIPIAELLNSAVEALTDLVSPDYHELAGAAKDLGSAAVMLAILANGLAWALALW